MSRTAFVSQDAPARSCVTSLLPTLPDTESSQMNTQPGLTGRCTHGVAQAPPKTAPKSRKRAARWAGAALAAAAAALACCWAPVALTGRAFAAPPAEKGAAAPDAPPAPGQPPAMKEAAKEAAPPAKEMAPGAEMRKPDGAGDGAEMSTTRPATAPSAATVSRRRQPVPIDAAALTDEKIGAAIKKAADALYAKFDPKTHLIPIPPGVEKVMDLSYQTGLDALCLYAVMQAGLATEDKKFSTKSPDIRAMVNALRSIDLENKGSDGHAMTYARGLRSTALALYMSTLTLPDKPENAKNSPQADDLKEFSLTLPVIKKDAEWSVLATDSGGYSYKRLPTAPRTAEALLAYYKGLNPNALPKGKYFDNSNSQYGVLAVWSAADAEVGVEVPSMYWALVDNHWTTCQENDGTWGYSAKGEKGGTLSMTCAGLASSLVTHQYLDPASFTEKVGREPFSKAVKKGLAWFEAGDNCIRARPATGTRSTASNASASRRGSSSSGSTTGIVNWRQCWSGRRPPTASGRVGMAWR